MERTAANHVDTVVITIAAMWMEPVSVDVKLDISQRYVKRVCNVNFARIYMSASWARLFESVLQKSDNTAS